MIPKSAMLAYHPDFGQLVSYQFDRVPDDPDTQVRLAVHAVIRMVLEDCGKPIIQRAAAQALELGGGDPITGAWRAIKPFIQFRQDVDIANDLDIEDTRKRDVVETFLSPATQARLIQLRGFGVEDCDGYTMYAACLLRALGIPTTMCTVAAERDRPRLFSHVYLVAYRNGVRIPMDLSHGPYPGWECPNLDRLREWPVSAETLRPSILLPLLLATAAGAAILWGTR
jgi:hypothetical protein